MTKLKQILLVPISIAIIGIIYLYEAFKMPFGQVNAPDRSFMPVIYGFVLLGFCLVQILTEIFRPEGKKEKSILSEEEAVDGETTGPKKPIILIISLLIYCIFFNKLGFIVATIPLVFVALRVMEYRSWKASLIVAIIVTLVTYFVFVEWLKVYFPAGILG